MACAGSARTDARVATGTNAGVSISPWGVENTPRRALDFSDFFKILNENTFAAYLFLPDYASFWILLKYSMQELDTYVPALFACKRVPVIKPRAIYLPN